MKQPAVYILANRPHGTLYIGVTSDVIRRVYQHKQGAVSGFSKRYGCKMLVYFEQYEAMIDALQREKRLKKYRRADKISLIEKMNPKWHDLYALITE